MPPQRYTNIHIPTIHGEDVHGVFRIPNSNSALASALASATASASAQARTQLGPTNSVTVTVSASVLESQRNGVQEGGERAVRLGVGVGEGDITHFWVLAFYIIYRVLYTHICVSVSACICE